jgi:hypothetical protein
MRLIIDESFHPEEDGMVKIHEASDKSGQKRFFIEGVFCQSKPNRNGRFYPKDVLKSAVDKYVKEHVEQKRAIGELNHPANPTPSAERASHIIEKLFWTNDQDVSGKARILEADYFPMAKIATGLIREGVKFGVSTRGLGSLTESNGMKIVGPDYFITAIDLVHEPSGIDCWVQGLHEGQDWIYDASSNSWIIAEALKNKYDKMTSKAISESMAKDFESFLNNL